MSGPRAHPLFARCPLLRGRLPHVPLGTFPTPLTHLEALGAETGVGGLWVKRDDLSGEPYGGNKVRKLEYLLADAMRSGAREIVTFGAAGSNHALATAVYGARLGFDVSLFLTPQPNSHAARRNLLADLAFGADIHSLPDRASAEAAAAEHIRMRTEQTGRPPYVIPFGGTTPLSAAGLADAGLELAMQVRQGLIPEPDVVYVALGSMGTAAGIALGLAIAQVPAEVRAVRVTPESVASEPALEALIQDAADLLCGYDPDLACVDGCHTRVRVIDDFFGEGYALYTEAGQRAVKRAGEWDIALEGTYTGKTFAALLADAERGELKDSVAVLWDTYNSAPLDTYLDGLDHRDLPVALHTYFTDDVQPLDRR